MNKFLPIIDNWDEYFQHRDEGLGTTYERLMLHCIFKKIDQNYEIKSVLEIPSFGMTGISGINSLWWARQGKEVTIIDDNEKRIELIKSLWNELDFQADFYCGQMKYLSFIPKSFDLVWNFAALWFFNDLSSLVAKLKMISNKIILICVPNDSNHFYYFRKFLWGKDSGLYFGNIKPKHLKNIISDREWRCVQEGYFDIPPWPDIPIKKEVLLDKLKLSFLRKRKDSQNRPLGILDYYNGKDQELQDKYKKWQILENSPRIFQRFWAHHRYLLFERM
jgi:hypothetical protein